MSESILIRTFGPREVFTLREYADKTKTYLQMLQDLHPAFGKYYLFGDKAKDIFPILDDFSNLDDLIYKWSWDKRYKRQKRFQMANNDGSPSWQTPGKPEYCVSISTGGTQEFGYKTGDIDLRIAAGGDGLPGSVVIELPLPDHEAFPHRDFFEFGNLKEILSRNIEYWGAWSGDITQSEFMNLIGFEYGTDLYNNNLEIGWMTYLKRKTVSDYLPKAIEYEALTEGVLFWLNRDVKTLVNEDNVSIEKAVHIRDCLVNHGLLKVFWDYQTNTLNI